MSCGDDPEENVPQPRLELDFVASLTEIFRRLKYSTYYILLKVLEASHIAEFGF